MQKARKAMGLIVVVAMMSTLMVALAATPAQAAAGAEVVLLNPNNESSGSQVLSSKDGMTPEITAAAYGGDDWSAATTAYFYYTADTVIGSQWRLIGTDSTPTMPDVGTVLQGATPRPDGYPSTGVENYKAFSIDLNTQGLPGLIAIAVVICGEGTTSFDSTGAVDPADKAPQNPINLLPGLGVNCDRQGFTVGADFSVAWVNNGGPVIRLAQFPQESYNGDGLHLPTFQVFAQTTNDVNEVWVQFCEGVNPDIQFPGDESDIEDPGTGLCHAGDDTALGSVTSLHDTGTGTVWSGMWTATGAPGTNLWNADRGNYRLVAGGDISADGVPTPPAVPPVIPTMDIAQHYVRVADALERINMLKAVWDYDAADGDHTCPTGVSSETSQIDPWSQTDYDGDGLEVNTTAPAPATGTVDIDDGDNPVLKVCAFGPNGIAFPLSMVNVAYEIVSGPGGIDADSPIWQDAAAICPPFFTSPCGAPNSGGYAPTGDPILFGSYTRPGNVADPPLAGSPRNAWRVCALGPGCQNQDITDGQDALGLHSELGADWAAVNSLQTGTTVYRVFVDKNGDGVYNAAVDGPEARATMNWTGGGRNHNHLWQAGTSGTDGHAGTGTIPAPAGSTVDLEGIAHDVGHNGVSSIPVIWRIGVNAPGHFVSSDSTTDPSGRADARIGSSVLDAARTTPVFFCGDGDNDGICDDTPAVVEINWGGVVTSTSISSFNVNPTIGVFGTDFTISGTLLDGSSAPVSSATVSIQRRTLGSSDWVTIRDIITNGTGSFSTVDVDPAYNSDYRAVFPGNVSYTGATSNTDRAWVRVGIAKNVSDTTAFAGQRVRISGRVLPAHPGDVVTLQVLDNGRGWKNIASARLSSASTYAFSVVHHSSKSLLFRVTYPTQGILNAWNVSRNTRITWA